MSKCKFILSITILMLASGSMLACNNNSIESQSPPPGINTTGLAGTQWKVTSLDDKVLSAGTYISIYFSNDGTVWGYNGCNIYGGKYLSSNNSTLKFEDITMTLLGCLTSERQHDEELYHRNFAATVSYKINEKRLEFLDKDGEILIVFQQLSEYAMKATDLIGTKWQCVAINGITITEGLSITLSFTSENSASGDAGCFGYNLSYQTDGDNIRFGTNVFRKGELTSELEEKANQYTSLLIYCASYRLSTDKLEIFTAKGDVLEYSPR